MCLLKCSVLLPLFYSLSSNLFSCPGNNSSLHTESPYEQVSCTYSDHGLISQDSFDIGDIIDDVWMFEEGCKVLQFGVGFGLNIDLEHGADMLNQNELNAIIPALSVTFEKNIWQNVGLGITLGTQFWDVPKFDYQYRYHIGSVRTTYHFNIDDPLDPYIGASATARFFELRTTEGSINESKISTHYIIGARYYITGFMGVYLEYGNATLTNFDAGISFYFQ